MVLSLTHGVHCSAPALRRALAVRKGTLNSVFAALIVAVATYMLIRSLGLI
jgi:hypothetical protein